MEKEEIIVNEKLRKFSNNKRNMSNHNGIISFWKFMFSMMIVIYHFNLGNTSENLIIKYGYIGVEYFFLVSGYLMAKSVFNKKENNLDIGRETFKFIYKKIKIFFPYMLVTFIITLILNYIFSGYSININQTVNSIWNLLFLETSGIRTTLVIGQTWYISAMLISMLILYPLIRKYKKNFIYLIAPAITIFIGGWISHNYGSLNGWQYAGVAYKCLFRAFFELALGTILYEVTDNIKKVNFTKLSRVIFTFIETAGFISIFFITNIENANNKYEFAMILILSISIVLAFSEKTLFYNWSNNKIFYYLEKLSLVVYLNHNLVIKIINKVFVNLNYFKKLTITIFATIIFSIIVMHLIENLKKKICKHKNNIKKIFIIDS